MTKRSETNAVAPDFLSAVNTMFDGLPFAVAAFKGNSLLTEYVNQFILNILQLKKEDVLGRPLFEIMPEIRAGSEHILRQVYETGKRFSVQEYPINLLTSGTKGKRYFTFIVDPLFNSDGETVGLLATAVEATEQVIVRRKLEVSEAALIKKQYQLDVTFQNVPSAIYMLNSHGDVIFQNERGDLLIGKDVIADGIFRTFRERIELNFELVDEHNVPVPFEKRPVGLTLQTGEQAEMSLKAISKKDHSTAWWLLKTNAVLDDSGKISFVLVVITDITTQKNNEEQLRLLKEQFELTIENVPSAVYLFNHEGTLLYVNKHGTESIRDALGENFNADEDLSLMLGMTRDLVYYVGEDGKPLNESDYPVFKAFRTGRKAEIFVKKIKRSSNEFGWFLNKATPLLDDQGKVKFVISSSTDFTEQKIAQEYLHQSEGRFKTLAETLPQLVWVTDQFGKQEFASRRWKEYSGIDPSDENSWSLMVHAQDLAVITKAWNASLETGLFYLSEARLKNKAGEYRWHFVQAEPIRDSEGKIIKWIGAFTDVHDRKMVTEKLEKLVVERTKELQRSNEDLQQFAHVASHDLKEPVRKILTFGNRLKQEFNSQLPEKANTYLSKIESSAIRMYSMIDGVLLYSSLNALEETKELVDLNEILNNIVEDLEVMIVEKNATIQVDEMPSLEGSPILLYQLFYNLLNNALKFSRANLSTAIAIKAEEYKDSAGEQGPGKKYVRISVQDNGIGFRQEDAEKIFKTFSRLNSKDKYEGTGLGLGLCQKIVERHGGNIWAQGKEGEGAVFYMMLPLSV